MARDPLFDRKVCRCESCGFPVEGAVALLDQAEHTIEGLNRDLIGKRAKISRLEGENAKSLTRHPKYPEACEVLYYWAAKLAPKAREIVSPDRLRPTIARLMNGHTAEGLKLCVDGYARFPYVVNGRRCETGADSQRHVEPHTIFLSPGKVERGIELARQGEAIGEAFSLPGTTSALGEAALRLADHGFHIFPVRPNAKQPATRNGLLDAKRDRGAIEAAWRRHPFNIGVRCGKESGIVVLDVDGEAGWDSLADLEQRFEKLPPTTSVKTPSGGQHFYFAHPGEEVKNSASLIGPCLDIRGDGGYVLAPPSIVDGKRYEVDEGGRAAPFPAWLLAEIRRLRYQVNTMLANGELEAFMNTGASVGNRNDRLFRFAASELGRGRSQGDVFTITMAMNEKYCKPPLPPREVEKLVTSAVRTKLRATANA